MTVCELIRAKRDGRALTWDEIDFLVSGFAQGQIPDYEFSAFLMAAWFQGMTFEETVYLTQAMMNSGKVFDLGDIPGPKVDKHSTGGVGDKVSLILAPLAAACGIKVPMVAGRGLGHTGGTLDKLESIPGFKTDLTEQEFRRNLRRLGLAVMGQTAELVPADRKMYALRDVTATVDSIPLIAASIMSKKLAEGIDGLVLDVKTGSGAFMPRLADARKLARTMIEIGSRMGKRVIALLTDMSRPLGRAVGNSLEVIEAIEALKGRGEPDLMELTFALGTEMLRFGGVETTPSHAERYARLKLVDGSALGLFRRMVKAQGGDERVIDDYARLPTAKHTLKVTARTGGFVQSMHTLEIGMLSVRLGAGRQRKEDEIDPAVGFRFRRKTGERVRKGDVLVDVLANDRKLGRQVADELGGCFQIGRSKPTVQKLVIERIRS